MALGQIANDSLQIESYSLDILGDGVESRVDGFLNQKVNIRNEKTNEKINYLAFLVAGLCSSSTTLLRRWWAVATGTGLTGSHLADFLPSSLYTISAFQ